MLISNGKYKKLNSKFLRLESGENPPTSFSMSFNTNHFDVTDNGINYKVPDMRYATVFQPSTLYSGQLIVVATVTASSGDDAQAIRNAIETAKGSTEYVAGEVVAVRIPAGTWNLNSVVEINDPRIHLVGDGIDVTIIQIGSTDVGDFKGIFNFEGSFGTEIGGNPLTQNISEGDTRFYIPNSSFVAGQFLYIQKKHEPAFFVGNHAKTGGTQDVYAAMAFEIEAKGTDGTGEYVDVTRPALFDVDESLSHRIWAANWQVDNGISDLTIDQDTKLSNSLLNRNHIHVKACSRFWVRNVKITRSLGHFIDWDHVFQARQENNIYEDGYYRGEGGGRSYIGWWKATDSYMTGCTGTFGRHIAFQNFARGCYIGQSSFEGMDINYHADMPGDNLIEDCTKNDNTQSVALDGPNNRDIYEQIVTSIDSTVSNQLSVADNRNCIWNCDFDGRKLGGGIFDGGLMRDFTFAYNRLMIKGNAFGSTDHSWYPAQRNPMLAFSVPSLRNKYVGNEMYITQDGFNDAHAVVRRNSHNESNSPDVHLLNNNFYNYSSSLQIRDTIGGTDSGNTWTASQASIPNRPSPPENSLLAYQLANHAL